MCEVRAGGRFKVTRHHGGALVCESPTQDAAIIAAQAESKRTGERHDVYQLPRFERIVACFPYAMLWERDLAPLSAGERVRRYQEAELVARV
jgi:hypothetical protein